MAGKSKCTGHHKIKNPSPSPPTSSLHSKSPNPKQEVTKKNTQPIVEIKQARQLFF